MKNLKINVPSIIIMFFSVILFNSCETENNDILEQSVDNEFAKFKSAFPHLSSKISLKNIQKVNIASALSKSINDIEGVTFPLIDDDFVIGRYIGLDDESIGIYIDFGDYTNKITIYDVNGIESPQVFEMVLDLSTNTYKPVIDLDYQNRGWRYWVCAGGCTAVSVAISLVDGPAPLMDILAVAYQLDCVLSCAERY